MFLRSGPVRLIEFHLGAGLRPKRTLLAWRQLATVALLLSVAACSPVAPTGVTTGLTPAPSEPAIQEPLPEAVVTFQVTVPVGTPRGQPLYLSILDEVTGLALNPRRIEMQAVDALHYQLELPLPMGMTIKYRYSRQGDYLAEEHTSINTPVRYRLYRVDGPSTVQDTVSAWSDMPFGGPTGRIWGQALDFATGHPISNLLAVAGGAQAITASDGAFLLEGLPPGTHHLVLYAMDGSHRTFQQGAVVARDSTTPATVRLQAAPPIQVTFTVQVPEDTMPAVPVRLAGDLSQLGNTFANLTGGWSTIASRMPVLQPLPDGRYRTTLTLPAGTDLTYKYTLGDGFWNAEHLRSGAFRLRRLIIPDRNIEIEDQVDSWGSEFYSGPVIFDVTVPQSTPPSDQVSIQFSPFGWTEPVPMWPLEGGRWVFRLSNPILDGNTLIYRYCRNDQCGSADDALTAGTGSAGRQAVLDDANRTIKDTVESWNWPPAGSTATDEAAKVRPRGADFISGVEFQPSFHPSWIPRNPETLSQVASLGANWLVLTPTWTFTRQVPPVLEPVTGSDPLWPDIITLVAEAQARGLQVGLFPTPRFIVDENDWWDQGPGDSGWWAMWFERYRSFLLHYADLAQLSGVQALILGGEAVLPALPGDGLPADVESLWSGLIIDVRDRYKGDLLWAMPAGEQGLGSYPKFIELFDQIYLLWSYPLSSHPNAEVAEIRQNAEFFLDTEVLPFQVIVDRPVVLGLAYPSAEGGITGCIPDPAVQESDQPEAGNCLDLDELSRPEPDLPAIQLDLAEQQAAYEGIFRAINQRDWISGVVARGYYPPAALQDKSMSIHGKPAESLIARWFTGWSRPVD